MSTREEFSVASSATHVGEDGLPHGHALPGSTALDAWRDDIRHLSAWSFGRSQASATRRYSPEAGPVGRLHSRVGPEAPMASPTSAAAGEASFNPSPTKTTVPSTAFRSSKASSLPSGGRPPQTSSPSSEADSTFSAVPGGMPTRSCPAPEGAGLLRCCAPCPSRRCTRRTGSPGHVHHGAAPTSSTHPRLPEQPLVSGQTRSIHHGPDPHARKPAPAGTLRLAPATARATGWFDHSPRRRPFRTSSRESPPTARPSRQKTRREVPVLSKSTPFTLVRLSDVALSRTPRRDAADALKTARAPR